MLPPFRLYLISDERRYPNVLEQHLPDILQQGGVGLQIREKHLSPRGQFDWVQDLLTQISPNQTFPCYVNDRVDIAWTLELAGVHLREDSIPCDQLHPMFRQNLSIGVSTHSLEGVIRAEDAGADFVTLGPIFPTTSKANGGPPLDLEQLEEAAQICDIPIFALGGITLDRVEMCLEAGAFGVAAISSVWGSESPVQTVREFIRRITWYRLLQGMSSPRTHIDETH